MTTKNDLWPEDLTTPPSDAEPRVLLEEQAALLRERTAGKVVATVRRSGAPSGRELLSLVLTAPALRDYEYTLLSVEQPAKWYPCRLTHEGVTWVGETETAFRQYLASSLQSAATRKVVSSLAAETKPIS